MWGYPRPVLGAVDPFLEPFRGRLSPNIDNVSEKLTLRYPHEGPWVVSESFKRRRQNFSECSLTSTVSRHTDARAVFLRQFASGVPSIGNTTNGNANLRELKDDAPVLVDIAPALPSQVALPTFLKLEYVKGFYLKAKARVWP